jgi:nucleotide-binding universal stress UspA family protein
MDEAAFAQTKRIAAGGAEVHLLHVVPSRAVPVGTPLMGMVDAPSTPAVAVGGTGAQAQVTRDFPPMPPADAASAAGTSIYDQAARYLEGFRQRLRGLTGQDIVRTGDPADAILEVALMFNIDLIVMATHARTGIARWFLGSVSQTVLRRSQLPVLLVRRGNVVRPERLRRILVPLDGTAESRSILSVVKPLAARVHAEILLLEVIPRRAHSTLSTRPASGDPQHDPAEDAEELAKYGVAWRSVTVRGDPTEQILKHAKSRDADVIAMSTRAREGIWRNSVAEAVLREAIGLCPPEACDSCGTKTPSSVRPCCGRKPGSK